MASYSVLIGGNSVTVLAGSLQFAFSVGRKSSGSFKVRTDTNTFFLQYQRVQVYDASNTLVFSGYLTTPQAQLNPSKAYITWTLQCIGQDYLAKKRVVAATYANKTCGFIVQDIMNNILASEGVTAGQIYDGLTPSLYLYPSLTLYPGGNVGLVPQATFYYCKVADALDAMVKEASSSGVPYYWMIDQNKQLWFVPYTTVTGPTIDSTQIDLVNNPPKITFANPSYRNTQYVTGGVAQTTSQTETRQGDGKTRTFTMSYAIAAAPTITVNGISKTVGIKGSSGFQYYWAENDNVITQDTSETILVSTDTLSVTYIGQYPNTAIINSASQIAYQASVDGTSGINEEVENDNTLTTAANAISEGSNLITRFAVQGAQFTFTTQQSGFVPGQLCPVNIPNIGLTNTNLLIETVTITDSVDNFNIWYQVTAILGPYDVQWVNFFAKLLAQQAPASSVNIGTSQQTSILQQFTATLTPSATLNTAVFTSLFPSTTLFPNTTLFPAG